MQTANKEFVTKEIKYFDGMELLCSSLSHDGALLVVEDNAMTIGWATVGIIWGKPIITVLVRKTRYTYELIERSNHFSVCVPETNTLKEELALCGTQSGRNTNKIKECRFNLIPGKLSKTNIITNCSLFYEARIVHKNEVSPETVNAKIKDNYYSTGHYHSVYYGKIEHCYLKDNSHYKTTSSSSSFHKR
ncbi:MAG: flavin reductase [Oligoflexia bacterium]|nr:flavin reductase [Oligoflexia bacterium]